MQIEAVKRNLNKMVVYGGKRDKYQLTACIIRRVGKGFDYQAELLDTTHGKSVIICNLQEIEEAQT